jgi:hypothetical protein
MFVYCAETGSRKMSSVFKYVYPTMAPRAGGQCRRGTGWPGICIACVMTKLPGGFMRESLGRLLAIAAGMGFLAGAAPALAHHAFAAEYDADRPFDLTGIVTKARWTNPHSWLYFDVKGADGGVTNWGVEFGAPNNLEDNGLKKTDLQAGTKVHILGYRSKNGGPFGYSVTLTLDDGRTFKTGGAQDAPARTALNSSGDGA